MRASEIHAAVEAHIRRAQPEPETLVRHELTICVGEARVDVAAVNGSIFGYEIKSAADSLARLPRQIEFYGRVVDRAVLVAERARPERLLRHLPPWWGLWHVSKVSDGVSLREVRFPARNPSPDPLGVAQLLWRSEALDVLRRHGVARGLSSANRWRLWEALAANLPLPELQREVRHLLTVRQEW